MLAAVQKSGKGLFSLAHRALDRAFPPAHNPLNHLGALTIYFGWIVLVSGIWLFIFFRTSVSGAFESVEYLTHEQWYLGGIMRSLHRYASDALIVTLLLHLLKEFCFDRYRGNRWFSWVTGGLLVWIVFPLGITGYWLVWDELAQYVALTSAELLDSIPVFTGSMAANFLSDSTLSDRFFTLMAFLHLVGLPIFLVFGIWLHVFRLSRPKINPPRQLMAGTLLALLLLSAVLPAYSQAKADLATMPLQVGIDWFYLHAFPLVQWWSPGLTWLLLVALTALLVIAPWLPPARRTQPALVDLDNCNGCRRCADDCPYSAIEMRPRSDGKSYAEEAVVDPDLCVSCGICVGACPTATPFRRRSALIPGIDLPQLSASDLREQIEALTYSEAVRGGRILTVCCAENPAAGRLRAAGVAVLEVVCMGQLPPPYLDFILSRDHADGVVLTGCSDGDCQFRFGAEWTAERIGRSRDPHLRKRVDTDRIAMVWQAEDLAGQPVERHIARLRDSLRAADDQDTAP